VIDSCEFVALLVTVTAPEKLATTVGVKTTERVAVSPGAIIKPAGTEVAVKPWAGTVTPEIVAGALPELVIVTTIVLPVPTTTVPKFKLVVLALSCAAPELTESMAGLLATLPTELLTTTVNTEASSAADVAGVV
jgi:hypothetical protein